MSAQRVASRPATASPSAASLLLGEAKAQVIGFFRTPIAAFFTLAFPLILLNLIGLLVGNDVIESRSGVRVTQFLTPALGAYAAASAAYTTLAIALSIDRERGVLRRHRALPIPTASLLGGRVAAGVVTGLVGVLVMVLFGVARFGVDIVWAKLPAAVLTLLIGVGCFAALGFAVSSLARTSAATQAITNATLVPLAFISDVFVVGTDLPEVLARIGGAFPLKAFANALGETFNPFTPGAGFEWGHLALMVAWGIGGVLVAARRFSWETPRDPGRRPRRVAVPVPPAGPTADPSPSAVALPVLVEQATPSAAAMAWGQVIDGIKATVRTPSSAFFTLAFPTVMLLLFSAVFGNPELDDRGGVVLAQHLAPALGIFGMATVTYAEFAERLSVQRDQGILKRVRGTPLPVTAFVAGRIGAAVVLGVVTTATVMVVGVLAVDVTVSLGRLPSALLVLAVGIASFTVLGLALVALAPRAEAVSPLANGTLLPLAFVSDVFLIGNLPAGLSRIADVLPLRPAVTALSDVLNPALDSGIPWARLGVVALWGAVGGVVVWRRFSWSPRR